MELFEGQTIVFSFIFSKTDNYFKVFSEPKLYGNMLFLAVTQKISPCNFLGTQLECILSCSSVCFMLIKLEHETRFLSNRHFSTKTYRKWVITHSGSSKHIFYSVRKPASIYRGKESASPWSCISSPFEACEGKAVDLWKQQNYCRSNV